MKRRSKIFTSEAGNRVRLSERSAADIIRLESLGDSVTLQIADTSAIIARDSLKYNFKWYNPLSWPAPFKYSIRKLMRLHPKEILSIAKNVYELEGVDTSHYRFMLDEMSPEEKTKYLEKLKKKVEEAAISGSASK